MGGSLEEDVRGQNGEAFRIEEPKMKEERGKGARGKDGERHLGRIWPKRETRIGEKSQWTERTGNS